MSNENPPLLPCPFCGKALVHEPELHWFVHPGNSGEGIAYNVSVVEDRADRAALWNRRASGKTECRPAGAVPADAYTYEDGWLWRNGKNVAKCSDEEGARIVAALRGRVVGAAAPGEREAFEAWWVKRYGAMPEVTFVARHNYYITDDQGLNEAWEAWQARAALTSAAPPPVKHTAQCEEKARAGHPTCTCDEPSEPPFCRYLHADRSGPRAAPPPDAINEAKRACMIEDGRTCDGSAGTRCAIYSTQGKCYCGQGAAPPPVVPQVVHSLRTRLGRFGRMEHGCIFWAGNGPAASVDLFILAADAIAALGAAQTDLQAVGRAQGQHDAGGARSQPASVPSTKSKGQP